MSLADYIKNDLPYWPNWFNCLLLKMNLFADIVYGRAYRRMMKTIDDGDPEQKLLETVNYAIENVPYYRKKYGNLKIHSKEEFNRKIGFIDKDEVMAHWTDFLVDNIDWNKVLTGTTGGTSGKPLKLVFPKNRYVHSLAFIHKLWKSFGWNYDTRAVFRNHHIDKNRDYIISPVLKEVIFDTFRMNDQYALVCWKTLKKFNIRFVHAYPSSFYQFCKLCQRQNLSLDFIKAAFLASEGVTVEQQTFFNEFGVNICSFYGHSENLILAGNRPNDTSYIIEENFGYCELVDDDNSVIVEDNILGELVGTTFCNHYFPLIRYKTGDYSKYAQNNSIYPDMRALDGVLGRRRNSLIYRIDGTCTTLTALNLHSSLYMHIDGLQYIQEKIGFLEVDLIKNDLYTDEDENLLYEHFGKAMGGNEYVQIKYVRNLILQPNGKFLPLISRITS